MSGIQAAMLFSYFFGVMCGFTVGFTENRARWKTRAQRAEALLAAIEKARTV
jgi:hypothetical protein